MHDASLNLHDNNDNDDFLSLLHVGLPPSFIITRAVILCRSILLYKSTKIHNAAIHHTRNLMNLLLILTTCYYED